MFVPINDILITIDDTGKFKPMVWQGRIGEIKIPVINTIIYDEDTQITHITTEHRPVVHVSETKHIELLTIDELCNNFCFFDNTQITPLKLRQQCLWLSLQDAQAKYKEQIHKLCAELTDTCNANIDLLSEYQITDVTLNTVINNPFGYTYLLETLTCKQRDISVLVYQIPVGVCTSFSASSVFLSTTAPMREYTVQSTVHDIWYIVCPIIDGVPNLNSLTVVDDGIICNEFVL